MKKILFLFVAAFVCALGANAEVWKKVTSAPADWSGKYLIACDNGEDWAVLDGSRSGDPNSGNLQSTMNYKPYDVNAEGNIELDACDYYVTIAPKGNAYTICTASGWYIGNNADANTLGTTANEELAFLSTISLDAEQGVLITAVEGGSVLRYNHMNGQDRFRFYKASTYTNQQKIALYKLEEAAPVDPVVPEIDGYEALSTAEQLSAGTYLLLNRYGWGVGAFTGSKFSPLHVEDMDTGNENVHNTIWIYDGEVNGDNLPSEFEFVPTSGGKFYMKDAVTGKYVNGTVSLSESDTPATEWYVTLIDPEHRYFEVGYDYNNAKYVLQYDGYNPSWWPFYGVRSNVDGQPMRLYRKGGANGGETPVVPVEPTTTFKGVVTPNLTSVSSLEELEGIELTFVDADQVTVLEEDGDGIYVQNEDGSEFYAIWHPGFGGTYEVNGNVVTLYNFLTDNSDGYFNELPTGKSALYFEDYGTFGVSNADADWDGYFKTFSVAFEGAPVAVPFELVFRNNNVVCENGKKVEANEAGVGADFYLVNEGLTAVGKTATLYKDGNAMSFVMTLVDATAISFLGGSSLITEPGSYLLEVPAGTYVDAAGNPNVAFYGQWVVIQKDEPVVDPVKKDKYTIKLSGTDYYFTTTEVKDNNVTTYSISATPEYFYIEPSGNGYTIKSADTDKWVGYDVISNWDFSNDEKVWTISSLEGEPTLIRKNSSKGFGVDDRFEGAGVYTDKSGQYWVIEKFFEPEPEPTVWNGNVNYSEAASVEDLLNLTVEFEEAASVAASGYDVLGIVYEGVEPYAIVLANGTFDVFGGITFEGSKAKVNFQKIADLDVNAQAIAKANIAKIGAFEPQAGKASVVFAGKSFLVDGELVAGALCNEYEFNGGTITGIESIATEGAAQIFDLQGRRVRAAQKGIFLINGKKVVK